MHVACATAAKTAAKAKPRISKKKNKNKTKQNQNKKLIFELIFKNFKFVLFLPSPPPADGIVAALVKDDEVTVFIDKADVDLAKVESKQPLDVLAVKVAAGDDSAREGRREPAEVRCQSIDAALGRILDVQKRSPEPRVRGRPHDFHNPTDGGTPERCR
jgi:hypothetical protein